ncbi:hypothetical protein IQ63_16350 [Streptomyces acidiscabies]|uniref:Uncharacterized protein n=1 Tax=Streptomyces acidiscabies TaxID=42234 RepID=A0A0L0K9S9_9ACTN|nr:hypothetical protein IQ63_16350 [Streptomyces acidiscabies]
MEAAQLLNGAGAQVGAAARIALDVHAFLQVSRYVAHAHDQEHATIARLDAQAEKSGKTAEPRTNPAKIAPEGRAVALATAKTGRPRSRSAALSGSDTGIVAHLRTGRADADAQDKRVRTAQLFDSSGAEVRAAARVPLEGPADLLHAFISTSR